ncbi:hypothetical protein D1007_48288 [Hordeum vulgare]|nr:hypothetical protein D1007_48288 [Hordeum vulgare]
MVCLPLEVATKIGSVKRSLIERMVETEKSNVKKGYPTLNRKWGPVLATRPVTRQHGNVKIMEKAAAYLKKKNLEIPASFQGKSFVSIDTDLLAAQVSSIDIIIGDNCDEHEDIVQDLIPRENIRCLDFADSNPETVLPENLDTPPHGIENVYSDFDARVNLKLGAHLERTGLRPCQVKRDFATMVGSLRRCSTGYPEEFPRCAGQASGRASEDRLE